MQSARKTTKDKHIEREREEIDRSKDRQIDRQIDREGEMERWRDGKGETEKQRDIFRGG